MSDDEVDSQTGAVDPTSVRNVRELARTLDSIRRGRSYSQLNKASGGHLPPSTLSNMLSGKTLPSRHSLLTFLSACGLNAQAQMPILSAWARVKADGVLSPTSRLGNQIADCVPTALEVHPAIDLPGVEGLAELPAYVSRAHDVQLRRIVDTANAGTSQLAMLVGGSSTGKTRACWEAIQHLPKQWRVWHPYDPTRPQAIIEALSKVGPHTVVWLNDAQHYLITSSATLSERIAAGLRSLLYEPSRGPVLILGTMWPNYWDALTKAPPLGDHDTLAQARVLLAGKAIKVPDTFTEPELDRLRIHAKADPRLQHAADHAKQGRITQHLAGVPKLLERYHHAPPLAKAVIHVAIDARRMRHPIPIPQLLLAVAAPGYVSEDEWDQAGDNWLERALAYTSEPCHGTPGPLTRIRPRPQEFDAIPGNHPWYLPTESLEQVRQIERGGSLAPFSFWDEVHRVGDPDLLAPHPCFRLADYLEQVGRIERAGLHPPGTFWDAVTRTTATNVNLMYEMMY